MLDTQASDSQADSGEGQPRTIVMVLGMHRSGTSTVAGALGLLGAATPKVGLGLNDDNPKGHFEPAAIVSLHDRILDSAGMHWWDWERFPQAWYASPLAAEFERELAQAVREEYGTAPIFVMKDPRTCKLVPLWRNVARSLDLDVVAVLPYRNPRDVARSLRARDGFPSVNGQLMWLRYALDAEVESRPYRRAFLRYEDLVADWKPQLSRLMQQTGLTFPRQSVRAQQELEEFIDPKLRHNRSRGGAAQDNEALHPWTVAVVKAYDRLIEDPSDATAQAELDRVRAEFNQACPIFFASLHATNRAFEFQHALSARIPGLEAAISTLQQETLKVSDLEAQLQVARQEIEALTIELKAASSIKQDLREQSERVGALRQQVHDANLLADQARIVPELQRQLAERGERLHQLEALNGLMERELKEARSGSLKTAWTRLWT